MIILLLDKAGGVGKSWSCSRETESYVVWPSGNQEGQTGRLTNWLNLWEAMQVLILVKGNYGLKTQQVKNIQFWRN